jgi:small subunit ribosomal protein S2
MSVPSVENLLDAGSHFGHQTQRWNPKMKPYILTQKNGIYVIDLAKTRSMLEIAGKAVRKASSEGKSILFVGTKVTSKIAIREAAERCGQFYVSNRWLGGMLTNFQTVKRSIKQLEKIEGMEADGTFKQLQKKEVLTFNRKREKLDNVFSGIRAMKGQPGLVVITDVKHEHIAVAEARRLRIPIVAICDTNVDPDLVDYVIPANDDAVKSVSLIVNYLADQVVAPQVSAQKEETPVAAPVVAEVDETTVIDGEDA